MSRLFNRKSVIVASVVAVIAAAGAYAYWTQSGSGEGSAATSADGQNITVNQKSVVADLSPNSAPQDLSGDFDNPNDGSVRVSTISASVTDVTRTPAAVAANLPCATSNYALTGFPYTVNATIAAGDDVGSWAETGTAPTIQLVESGANQDGCKGATAVITYSSN